MLWFELKTKIDDIRHEILDIRKRALREAERIDRLQCGQRQQGHQMRFHKRGVDTSGPNYTFRCSSCGTMRTWRPDELSAEQLSALAALGFPASDAPTTTSPVKETDDETAT